MVQMLAKGTAFLKERDAEVDSAITLLQDTVSFL